MTQPSIVEEFLQLVSLNVNSRDERAIADVLIAKLTHLGFEVEEDQAGESISGNSGNLIAFLPGNCPQQDKIPTILFSAHIDRVGNHGAICARIEGDALVSDGTSILGADDVSGICAILDGVRQVLHDKSPRGGLEIVFSVAEEVGLLGVKNLDFSRLKSKMAYVIDSGGPLGTLINEAPTMYDIEVKVYGRSAHAGLEPEKGLSAIKVAAVALARLREGRLSPFTTSNFGTFKAGKVTNIICDYAEIRGEARSLRAEELEEYLSEVRSVFGQAAHEFGATIELNLNLECSGFKVEANEPVIELARRAMAKLGLDIHICSSGGGMDGHLFNQNHIKAVGISPAYEGVHTPKERQPLAPLIKCGQLVASIIREAASGQAPTPE